jgi:hypothetical protein
VLIAAFNKELNKAKARRRTTVEIYSVLDSDDSAFENEATVDELSKFLNNNRTNKRRHYRTSTYFSQKGNIYYGVETGQGAITKWLGTKAKFEDNKAAWPCDIIIIKEMRGCLATYDKTIKTIETDGIYNSKDKNPKMWKKSMRAKDPKTQRITKSADGSVPLTPFGKLEAVKIALELDDKDIDVKRMSALRTTLTWANHATVSAHCALEKTKQALATSLRIKTQVVTMSLLLLQWMRMPD